MIYAYVKQCGKTQSDLCRFMAHVQSIEDYAASKGIHIDKWFDMHKINYVLSRMSSGDTLLASRISCLGTSLHSVEKVINLCMDKNIKVIVIEGNYIFENSLAMLILFSALKLVMKIQSELKSQTVSDALSRLQSSGKKLGRPQGSGNKILKLNGRENEIRSFLQQNLPKAEIARRLGVNRMTLYAFLRHLSKQSK